MNYAFLLAGGASAFGLVIHVMLGRSRSILPPKDGSTPERVMALDAWFGRHVVMIVLIAMALGFAHASRNPDAARDLAMALTLLGAAAALLRLLLAVRTRAPRLDVGEWGLTALAAALGAAGQVT